MSAAERAAFLRAIADNPDDDLPRLVFADWLDEHGEPARGGVIRGQGGLARLPAADLRPNELLVRESELLKAHGHGWSADWDGLRGVAWEGFERGFVGTFHVADVAEFVTSSEQALRAVPIGRLSLRSARTSDLRTLVESPVMAHLPALTVGGCKFGNAGAAVIAAAPGVRRL